ncbi:MAG: phosphoglucosamine mutase [Alphaproteobacteria bacterium]|nr:phosphoglucosamine mutase [Alphaproteobacteria bacterium]
MSDKLFGTDGIRGVANVYPLTIDFCSRLAVALSQTICNKQNRVAIARDTRISGNMLFNALSAGFTSQGVDVIDLGVIPTPLCTTATPALEVDMSIMITASHNPYRDNGLKLITAKGDKFSDEQSRLVEELLAKDIGPTYNPDKIGKIIKDESVIEKYLQTVAKLAPANALAGMKIVTDSANGAFSGIMPRVYRELGAEVISLADQPNGTNINQDCGSQHTENLCKTVVESHSRLGVAVDGDGDRIIVCDEKGNRLNGDQIIAYLTTYFKRHNMLKNNSAVATMYSNLGLGAYLQSIGVSYHTSAVGERYVIEKMREFGANVGGEESGHIVLSDYTLTGDALLASIVICLGVKESGKKMSEIFPVFEPYPTAAHNLRFASKDEVSELMTKDEFKACLSEAEKALAGHGSVIVRKSGTEPVMRLKIEDKNKELVNEISEKILACIKKLS